MERRTLTIIGIAIAITLMAIAIAGTSLENSPEGEGQEPVNESELSEDAQASVEGATELKQKLLDAGYSDARVFVKQDGLIGVSFIPDDSTEVKSEMTDVAYMYSDVLEDHPETGGLTISIDGVQMLVSQDATLAYTNGNINADAFEETLAITQSGDD